MSNPTDNERLMELLADEMLGQLSVEDEAELQSLRESSGVEGPDALGELLVAMDRAVGGESMPSGVAARVAARGRAVVAPGGEGGASGGVAGRVGGGRGWLAFAVAAVLVAAVSLGLALVSMDGRRRAERDWAAESAVLRERLASNEELLAQSRGAVERLRVELAEATDLTEEQRVEIAQKAERELELMERVASATSNLNATRAELDEARLTIARYEEPVDPDTLRAQRELLLTMPGTVRVAWSPFNVPEGSGLPPPEQGGVGGDVVWNDERQQGYLRFVGLAVNDPSVEQYQVWLIDERGMEQKVGGGVFNATAAGELIVPIEPGIDVGRVAVFAVTIEEPGGTWVPDLRRRAVVAGRGDGG